MYYSLPFDPNNPDDFSVCGRIVKVFGSKGELVARIGLDDPDKISNKESIFVEFDNGLIPFFIEEFDLS